MIKEEKINRFCILTTNPHRYGILEVTKENETIGKGKIVRFSVPQHKNIFLKQIITFIVYSIKTIVFTLKNYNEYDFILITSSRFGTAMLGFILSKATNKPLAIDIRDIFSDGLSSINQSKTLIFRLLIKMINKFEVMIIRHASWINFVSPGFKNYFNDNIYNIEPKTYTNGIDKIFIENRKDSLNKREINYQKPLKILYAGNIGYGQGLEKIIIPLAKNFTDEIIFLVIGDGSSKHLLLDEIKNNNIINIRLQDPVDRISLLNYYNEADALFIHLNNIPALNRVLPSKIFEYATFEKPIFAGVSGIASKFISENINGFYIFPPKNFNEAKIQIESVMKRKRNTIIDNTDFINKFKRSNIMTDMVKNIIESIGHRINILVIGSNGFIDKNIR